MGTTFLLFISLSIILSHGTTCKKSSDCPGYSLLDGFSTKKTKPEGFTACCYNKCVQKEFYGSRCPIDPSKTFPFICADGKSISLTDIKNHVTAADMHLIRSKIFEKCMVNEEKQCPNWPYAWKRNEDSCSIPQAILTFAKGLDKSLDGACIMHDLCYNNLKTGKQQCDDWFKQNVENMCSLMVGTGNISEKMLKFACDKLIGTTFYLSVLFGGKADKLWERANCRVNKNARYYVTIHSPKNEYIIAGVDSKDKPVTPKVRTGDKPISYFLHDPNSWSQFIIEESETVKNGYYIRSYIGAYLKCETNFWSSGLKHSVGNKNGTDEKSVFYIEPVDELVRFRNMKNQYIYVKDGKLKCGKDIKKANKWKMSKIKSPGPILWPRIGGVEQQKSDWFLSSVQNVYSEALVVVAIFLVAVSSSFCCGIGAGWMYYVQNNSKSTK